MDRIAIVISGNDMKWGPEYCGEQLKKILKWKPNLEKLQDRADRVSQNLPRSFARSKFDFR